MENSFRYWWININNTLSLLLVNISKWQMWKVLCDILCKQRNISCHCKKYLIIFRMHPNNIFITWNSKITAGLIYLLREWNFLLKTLFHLHKMYIEHTMFRVHLLYANESTSYRCAPIPLNNSLRLCIVFFFNDSYGFNNPLLIIVKIVTNHVSIKPTGKLIFNYPNEYFHLLGWQLSDCGFCQYHLMTKSAIT